MRSKQRSEAQLKFALDSDGEVVPLPLSMLMQTVFFGGYKGSGKTTSMKKLFEAAYEAGAQCVAIAPLGKWWSLRIAKNGKGKGLRCVVFGGPFGDVPIQPGSGRVIARAVHMKTLHAVLDVELMRKDERAVFLAEFFEELMLLRKGPGARGAMVVFLDETQSVAPQKSSSREVERLRVLLGDFARECRNFGCGLVMSAQRSASVDKELIALCEMLVVMRTVHHLDRSVYAKWVDEKGSGGRDDEDTAWLKKLRRLEKGQAYLYAPELNLFERVTVLRTKTYDATATATIGAKVAKVGKLSKLDVKRLSTELAEVVETAAANDPTALRARVKELERQLAEKPKGYVAKATVEFKQPKPPKPDKRGEKRAAKALKQAFELHRRLEHLVEKLAEAGASFVAYKPPFRAEHPVTDMLKASVQKLKQIGNRELLSTGVKPGDVVKATVVKQPDGKSVIEHVERAEQIVGKQKLMLRVLASCPLNKRELAGAVAQARGGTFDAYVSRLKTWGYITEEHVGIRLLKKGEDYVRANGGPLSMHSEHILERNSRYIVGKMKAMVNYVRDAAGSKGVTKAQIIEGIGQAPGGTADAYVSRLVAREILAKYGDTYSWSPMMERGR